MSLTSTISKKEMHEFLKYLSIERALVCPVNTGKVIEFRETLCTESNCDCNYLSDYCISYKALKEYYFPQTELMFTFEGDDVIDNANLPGYAIFGARPCDLEALRVMSIVYSTGKYADPFFQRHFDANFLIGVGCSGLKPECFCEEMGINKEFTDFCDVMLIDDGDNYTVTHLSEKGEQELNKFSAQHGKDFCVNKTDEPFPSQGLSPCPPCPLSLDIDADDTVYFDVIDWKKVTETCKGCGICTYICPTCYCFDFKDVSKKDVAERYKCWDSCMYPKFTLHASGHNPRENRHERYRQRVLHKYKYVPNNFDGAVACTGCGRCVRSCPVGINIKDILKEVIDKRKCCSNESTN